MIIFTVLHVNILINSSLKRTSFLLIVVHDVLHRYTGHRCMCTALSAL